MEHGNGKIKGPGLVRAEFSTPWLAVVTVKGKDLRIAGPSSSTDMRLRCVLNEGESIRVETEGLWSFHVEHHPRGERNSGIPVEVGIPNERPLTLREEMQRFIRQELSRGAESAGVETFEEANDFDVDEDGDWLSSQYEVMDMPEDRPASMDEPLDPDKDLLDPKAAPSDNGDSTAEEPTDENAPVP